MNKNDQWYRAILLKNHKQENVKELMNKYDENKNKFPMLEDTLNNIPDYQDETTYFADAAQITYTKYLVIKNTFSYLMILSFIFSLMTFSLSYHFDKEDSFLNIFLMIVVSFLKIMTVINYCVGLYAYGQYLTAIGQVSRRTSYLKTFGFSRIVFQCLLLIIHPVFLLNGVMSPWKEYYFTSDIEYVHFQREFNHYLYLIQFCIIFVNIFYSILENTFYAKTRSQRICNMFGLDNNMTFIITCILSQNGELFVTCMLFGGIFFFATLINVSEIGYYSATREIDFLNTEAYQEALDDRSILIYYFNTIWNTLITMTTIGYGDMYVRANLSRIVIFFCALYGTVIFPLMVLTITNLFLINRNETISINIIKMVDVKEILKQKAAFIIPNILKMSSAKRKKDQDQINYLKNRIAVQVKEFIKYKQIYQSLNKRGEINEIRIKLEKMNAKYNILSKKMLPIILKRKKKEEKIISEEKKEKIDNRKSFIKE